MDYWDGVSPLEFKALMADEDMEEFRSEKSVTTGKSPEEIEKYSVDESLSEMERACVLISTGHEIQKICVVEHLPDLLRNQQMDTLCRVFPKLCEILPSSSVRIQVVASKVLGEAMRQELIPMHIFTSVCLKTILQLLESKDTAVSEAWLATILTCIPLLPKDEVKRRILTIVLSKGQLSQTIASRQASCRILGAMAPLFDPIWIKQELLPLASTLCQDVDSQIRQLMCQQLDTLSRALGHEISEETILRELEELVNDEENRVRVAALEALTDMLSLWPKECLKTRVLPLICKFCESSMESDNTLLIEGVAKLIGRICYETQAVMTREQLMWFLQTYCQLSRMKPSPPSPQLARASQPSIVEVEPECKRLCAYNFPAMLLMVGLESYQKELAPTFESLAQDDSWRVRKTIACGFHEVVKILGNNSLQVSHVYQNMLKDSSPEVLSGLVVHLPEVLQNFAAASNLAPETLQPGLLDFIGPLLSFDQVAGSQIQWRLHLELIKALGSLITCMTSEQIYTKFVPLMHKRISGKNVLPIKQAAAYTLCIFIRHNRLQEQRNDMCTWIIEQCAKSSSCRKRLLFIDTCTYILELFSRSFFKSYFFDPLLQLAYDPVINIRLRLSQLLPSMKSLLKLPIDRQLLQNLEQVVRKLISQERDPDASHSIQTAVTEMDRIEVAMETLSRKTYFESDISDQQKEAEEKALIVAEEKERLTKVQICTPTGGKRINVNPSRSAGKTCPSPREGRKTSITSLAVIGGPASPGINRMNSKSKQGSGVFKATSAPSPLLDTASGTVSPSPTHHSPGTRKPRKQETKQSTGSPPIGERGARNTSANSSGGSVKSSSGGTKSRDAVSNHATTTNKSTTTSKKKAQSYALEYSSKSKKGT